MKKIKVLHLELDEHLGGIESFLYNLYAQIDKEKVQFDFVTRFNNPAKGDELKKLGANIYKVSSYKNPVKYMLDLKKIIKKENYNIVHIHKNSAAVIFPFLITREFKDIRVFVHSHNTKPSIGNVSKILHKMNKCFLYKSADEHFACSKVAGEWLYGNKKSYVVLRNGIVAENFLFDKKVREITRNEFNISDNDFIMGHIGRFTDQKNHDLLIDIFYEFQKIKSNAYLWLIGDGENKDEIYKKVLELGIQDKVIFLGIRNNVNELLMAMDAFVMPSVYEGLPISAIEAQATGVETFLSDTISKETEISTIVNWFSNEWDNKLIAKLIFDKCNVRSNRLQANKEIIENGFDMKETAQILLEYYKNCYIEQKCNEDDVKCI